MFLFVVIATPPGQVKIVPTGSFRIVERKASGKEGAREGLRHNKLKGFTFAATTRSRRVKFRETKRAGGQRAGWMLLRWPRLLLVTYCRGPTTTTQINMP